MPDPTGGQTPNDPAATLGTDDAGAELLHVDRFQRELGAATRRAFVTPALVIINLAVFVIMVVDGVSLFSPDVPDLLRWGANFAPKSLSGEPWRLWTSNYLHIGLLHIAFNMWVLWDAGRLVERLLGNAGFFMLYTLCGLIGSFASVVWHPATVSAGASGAIFGVYGCLLAFVASRRHLIPRAALATLQKSTVLFIGYNLVYGLMQPDVDMAAHVGGLVAGFALGLILRAPVDAKSVTGRLRRNLIAGLVGVAALGVGVKLFAHPYADLDAELRRFGVTEERVLTAFNQAVGELERGELDEPGFATRLEKDVLPPWREAHAQFEKVGDLPSAQKVVHQKLLKYIKLREEGWELLVAGIHEQDEAKILQGQAKEQQAAQILDEFQDDK